MPKIWAMRKSCASGPSRNRRDLGSLVSLMQVGLDMAPTKAQIGTWESGCKTFNETVAAWSTMQSSDLAAFNGLLTKYNLPGLTITATKLLAQTCTFTPEERSKK